MNLINRQAVLDGIDKYIEKAQSTGTKDDFISFAELVVKALPSAFEGMTNGEVIEAVWGYSIGINNDVLTIQTDINAVLVIIDIEGVRRELRFSLDWWRSPYKGVSE